MKRFNPSRLDIARKRKMWTKKKCAEEIGVNSHTVSLWDKGETEPSPENVRALAEKLDYPEDFFFGEDISEMDGKCVSFRSQATMPAYVRDAALAAGDLGMMVSKWVEARFDLPSVNIPDLHLFTPEETAARTLRQEWALGEKPISNMIQLLESKGVRLFSLCEETAKVNAFSTWRDGKPYVFLNTYKTAECSRFDAAHELAHLVLHQDMKCKGREAEDQANRFASAFLMPKSDVLAQLPRVTSLGDLIKAKARWKVSLAALAHRCHRLGIITDWKYRDFCVAIVRHGYTKDEPKGIERERSVVWQKVLTALWAEKVTTRDIAAQLTIPEREVSGLLCGVITRPPAPPPDNTVRFELMPSPEDLPRATA